MNVYFNTNPVWHRDGKKKTRIYGQTNEARVAEIAGMETHPVYSSQCMYKGQFHDESVCESCINDNEWKKWNRAEVKAMKESIVLAFETLGFEVPKVTFSRTAGCGCGCSAGHVASIQLVFLDEEGTPRPVESIHIK